MTRPRTVAALAALALAGGGAIALATGTASAAPSATVVLNEVYGGGGNSGAPVQSDFIELANRGSGGQDVGSWSVQYLNAGATADWQVTALTGSIGAGDNYLVGESGGANGTALPPTQADGTIAMAAGAGTVALVRSTTALTCKTAAACAADPGVVDLVGYGPGAVVREGTPAPAPSNTMSVNRRSSADTDDNGADFTLAAPTPVGTSTPPAPVRIHDIQGDTWLSPKNGQTVTDVPGIVTGIRTSGTNGFYLQDPTPDADPATSEGIFVYTSSAPTVQPGDSVLVSGPVSDYYPLASGDTVSATSNLSVTEISRPTVSVVSTGNPLPAPIVLTPSTVPDQYAPDLGGANIEGTAKAPATIMPTRSALDYFESIEGMRVEVQDARVVGPSDAYGEQYITTKPTQDETYRGGTQLRAENATPSGRLELITAAKKDNPSVDVGDVFSGATIGAIDYSDFGGYEIVASTVGAVTKGNLPPVVATSPSKKQLSVATYNVENLAPSDPQSKYDQLGQGVVTNLASPDVVALEEIQDNSGAEDDATVAADQTLTKLTAAITEAHGPAYQWREIDPVNDQDGGAPGGNIRVAFLFNPKRVSFVDSGSSSVNRSTTATKVVKRKGAVGLSLSPGRIDPANPVWTSSRKPLVGEFRFAGKNVFVVANHFDSKLGDQNADGRYQYPARSSEVQRAGQAAAVHDFVSSVLAADKKADVLVVGDLNDYQFSPALQILKTGTAAGSAAPILTDLITTLPVNQQYTYVYDGISQVLDHILVSPKVRGIDYQVVHVNSEYADQVSDHDPQVVDVRP